MLRLWLVFGVALYALVNGYLILRKSKVGEWLLQIACFAGALFMIVFGGYLVLFDQGLIVDGLLICFMGGLFMFGHLDSAFNGLNRW